MSKVCKINQKINMMLTLVIQQQYYSTFKTAKVCSCVDFLQRPSNKPRQNSMTKIRKYVSSIVIL